MSAKKKQKQLYLTPLSCEKLERERKRTGKTATEVVNELLEGIGAEQVTTPAGKSNTGLYSSLLAILEVYLIEAIERGIIEKPTRQAAAEFYELIVKELSKQAEAEAFMARMAVQN